MEPHPDGSVLTPVQERPDCEDGQRNRGYQDSTYEAAVDDVATHFEGSIRNEFLQPKEIPGSLRWIRRGQGISGRLQWSRDVKRNTQDHHVGQQNHNEK